jgi:site-specific DNA-cytosine methylase
VQQYTLAKNNLRRLTPIECERLQGFKDNWTSKGLFDGETKEISDSQRYKMLGNAVSVPVVEAIANRLKNNSKEITLTETTEDLQLLTLELQLELLHFKTAA